MRKGYLSEYFEGVSVKTLTPTEVDPAVSRGHELQGVDDFRVFLGTPEEKVYLPTSYFWLGDDELPLRVERTATWYDSRKGQEKRSAEYRLYYPAAVNEVARRARPGDTLFLCKPKAGDLMAIFCASGSSIEQQLLWLFDLSLKHGDSLEQVDLRETDGRSLDLVARELLELFGIEVIVTRDEWLNRLLTAFGPAFPTTEKFSAFTRKAVKDADPVADPDAALIKWMEMEEQLFRTLEKHLVEEYLKAQFAAGNTDADDFLQFSLSVHGTRKSRAGFALGNHVEAILKANSVTYKREAETEKRKGPDFLFPSEALYRTEPAGSDRLIMLAAKRTCKDRWRQVLAEADKIPFKHLLTLQPGISVAQTTEMQKFSLQLVVPSPIHATYKPAQQSWLLNVSNFLELVRSRSVA